MSKYDLNKLRQTLASRPTSPLTTMGTPQPQRQPGPQPTRLLIDAIPPRLVFGAVKSRAIHGVAAHAAIIEMLDAIPDLLAQHGLTGDSWSRPGTLMVAVRRRFEHLVRSDGRWWDQAKRASIMLDHPRPPDLADAEGGSEPSS